MLKSRRHARIQHAAGQRTHHTQKKKNENGNGVNVVWRNTTTTLKTKMPTPTTTAVRRSVDRTVHDDAMNMYYTRICTMRHTTRDVFSPADRADGVTIKIKDIVPNALCAHVSMCGILKCRVNGPFSARSKRSFPAGLYGI